MVLVLFCSQGIFGESKSKFDGYGGTEISIPSKIRGVVPDIKFRLGALLGKRELHGGFRFSWAGRTTVYVGNLVFSGTVSTLKNPDFSMTMSPLGTSSFSATGIATSLPSYSGGTPPLAVSASFSLGNKRPMLVQAAGTEEKIYTLAVTVPILSGKISVTSSTVAGLYFLPSTLPNPDDNWFAKDLPYDSEWNFAAVQEIRIRTKRFRCQILAGSFVSPFGQVDPWARIRGGFNAGIFSIDSGVYAGDSEIICANASRTRSTLQAFATPQIKFVLQNKTGTFLRFGISLGADGRNSNGKAPAFSVNEKFKFGGEFVTPFLRLRLFAGKTAEKYNCNLEAAFKELPLGATVYMDLGAAAFPKDDKFFDKTELVFSVSASPSGKWQSGFYSLIPSLSAKTTTVFRKDIFSSVSVETAASWALHAKFLTLRGKITFEWQYAKK